jgi:hypothetical protein
MYLWQVTLHLLRRLDLQGGFWQQVAAAKNTWVHFKSMFAFT